MVFCNNFFFEFFFTLFLWSIFPGISRKCYEMFHFIEIIATQLCWFWFRIRQSDGYAIFGVFLHKILRFSLLFFSFAVRFVTVVYYGTSFFLLINLSWEFYFWWRSKCGRSESDSINTDIYTAFGANSDLLSNPRRDAPPRQFRGYTITPFIPLRTNQFNKWQSFYWNLCNIIPFNDLSFIQANWKLSKVHFKHL